MVEQFILLVEHSEEEPHGSEKPATTEAKKDGKTSFKAYGAFETPDKATEWAHTHDLGANVKNFTAVTMLTPVN